MRISDWSSDVCSAERLMQAPDWADFEPGVLIPEIPVQVTTTTPPQSDTVDDAEFMETQLEGGKDGASQLALLLLENTARSEEHTSEIQSRMRSSYAVFYLTRKNIHKS